MINVKPAVVDFKTNYGKVSLSAAPLTEGDLKRLGFVDKSTNEILNSAGGQTCSFASKKYVLTALNNHNKDKNAHFELISNLVKRIDELSTKVDELESKLGTK